MRQKILYILLAVYAAAFPALIFLQYFGINLIRDKKVIILTLLLTLFTVIAFKMYRERVTWFLGIFLIWICITAWIRTGSYLKAFGGSTVGMWYICLFAYFATFLFSEKSKTGMLFALCFTELLGSTAVSGIAVYLATKGLFTPNVEGSMVWGMFKTGRLHALSNANTLGEVEAVSIIAGIWLVMNIAKCMHSERIKKAAGVILISFVSVLLAFAFILLSFSGSRGSTIALAGGIAVIIFSLVRNRLIPESCDTGTIGKAIKGFLIPLAVSAVCAAVFVLSSYGPKKAYDFVIFNRAEKTYGRDSKEYLAIKEILTPYGAGYEVSTLTDRTLIWRAVIRMMNEEPELWLTGVSAAEISQTTIQDVYEGRPDKVAYYAHNGYLDALFAYGIPGALMLLIILIEWLTSGVKTIFSEAGIEEKTTMAFAIIAMACGMVEGCPFPRVPLFMPSLFFFVAAGTAMGVIKRLEDGRQEKNG